MQFCCFQEAVSGAPQAAKQGEKIQWRSGATWRDFDGKPLWNFCANEYRIAPKKERTLIERLRDKAGVAMSDIQQAADRIEELESRPYSGIEHSTTDELLDEIKRRTSC